MRKPWGRSVKYGFLSLERGDTSAVMEAAPSMRSSWANCSASSLSEISCGGWGSVTLSYPLGAGVQEVAVVGELAHLGGEPRFGHEPFEDHLRCVDELAAAR